MLRTVAAIEGLDQSGKRTLTNSLADKLVADGYVVGRSDLPQYWINDSVRKMNRVHPGIMQILGRAQAADGGYRIAELRTAHYALDRAFTLAMYSRLAELHPDITFVSNRLVLSNAVTTGFAQLSQYLQPEEVPAFISDIVIPNERPLLDAFALTNVLCVNATTGHIARIEDMLDMYEIPTIQEAATRVYELIYREQARFGVHMTKVVTRNGDDWRPIADTVDEVREQLGLSGDAEDIGELFTVGPHAFIETFTPKRLIPREHHDLWEKARGLADVWEQLSVRADRKTLDEFELQRMAPALKHLIAVVPQAEIQIDLRAAATIARLFDRYPELVDIVRAGNEGFGDIMVSFMERLASQAQEG